MPLATSVTVIAPTTTARSSRRPTDRWEAVS